MNFYVGKAMWKKLFNRELSFKKEYKAIVFDQYHKAAKKKI